MGRNIDMPEWMKFENWGFTIALFLVDVPLVTYWYLIGMPMGGS